MTPVSAAQDLLRRFWNDTYPVDPCVIATGLSVRVALMTDADRAKGLKGAMREDDESHGSTVLIRVDAADAPALHFFVAHELGRIVLGHLDRTPECALHPSTRFGPRSDWAQATRFAAELLTPEAAVRRAVEGETLTPDSVGRLSQQFGVPVGAMCWQLVELGLL